MLPTFITNILPAWATMTNLMALLGALYTVVSFLATVLPQGTVKTFLQGFALDLQKIYTPSSVKQAQQLDAAKRNVASLEAKAPAAKTDPKA